MGKYVIDETTLTGIADAIRAKKGTTESIAASNFATEISSIGGLDIEELFNAQGDTQSGKMLTLKPISMEHEMKVKVTPSTNTILYAGKNLFTQPYAFGSSYTLRGVTFTVDRHGAINVNGTVTSSTSYFKIAAGLSLSAGTYHLSGMPSGVSSKIFMYIANSNNSIWISDNGSGRAFTLNADGIFDVFIYLDGEGVSANNLVVRPLLVEGAPKTYTPNSDGTVTGVKSIYPITTLSTNNGAVVSCNYIKDIGQTAVSLIERNATHYDIPAGTKAIGMHAFYNFQTLKTITIPKSVTSIGGGAFNSCSYLQSFKAPEGITEVGTGALAWCSRCKVFDFSDNKTVPTLGADGFKGSFDGSNSDAQLIVPYALYSSWSAAANWKDLRANMVTKGKAETGADVSIVMIWIDGTSSWKSENFNDNPDADVSAYCKKDGVEIDIDNNPYFTNLRFEAVYDGSYLDYHFTTKEWDKPVIFYKAGLYEFGVLNEDGKVTYRAYVEVTGDTPTFTFGYQYIAEYGMTFGEWVNSKYNTDGFYISGNGVWQTEYTQITEVTTNDYGYNDYRGVTVDEVIKPDGYYIVS